ncbi:hypothetical protein [Nostoc sp.]|uniref:hypothetical protein n=1 Tax=Nostoc sp. TaxID=1180 RepID=UPI002FFC0FA3
MTTKQAIFDAIEQLPEQHLKDVLQYVQKLAGTPSPASNPPTKSGDPLQKGVNIKKAPLFKGGWGDLRETNMLTKPYCVGMSFQLVT